MKKFRQICLGLLMVLGLFSLNNNEVNAAGLKAKPNSLYNFKSVEYGGSDEELFQSIIKTKDGGYLVSGTSESTDGDFPDNKGSIDILLAKYDKDFNLLWSKVFGGSDMDVLFDIKELADGSFVIVGYTKSSNGDLTRFTFSDLLVAKLDKDGNKIWKQKWGSATNSDNLYSVDILKDGNIVVSGYKRDPDPIYKNKAKGIVAKLNVKTGDIIWETPVYGKEDQSFIFTSAIELDNGNIVAVGQGTGGNDISSPGQGNDDAAIILFDSDGNKIADKLYGSSGSDKFDSILKDDDGNIIVSGPVESADGDFAGTGINKDLVVLKFDQKGNEIFRIFVDNNNNYYEEIHTIYQATDGTYYIVGQNGNGDTQGFIDVINKDGSLKYQTIINEKKYKTVTGIVETNPGEFAVVGSTTLKEGENGVIFRSDYIPNIKTDKDEISLHVSDVKTDDELLKLFNVSVSDVEDGDITSKVVIDSSAVNYNKLGDYDVELSVKDSSDATSSDVFGTKYENIETKTLKVKIINDKPIINVDSEKYSSKGKVISDDELKTLFNVKANDYEDGDLTSKVVVDSSAVDFNKIGDYNITFTVSDSLGETVSVTVVLHITNEKPIISADDIHQGHINEVKSDDDLLKLFNVSATDLEDGDLTSKIIIDSSGVDFNTEGTYEINLTVTDSDGNKVEKKVKIDIVADMDPELNSDDSKEVEEGNPLSDDEIKQLFNVMAKDYEDGDLTRDVVVDQSKVDYNTPGEYEIKFYIIDSYGNKVEKLVTIKITKSSKPISPDKPKDDNVVENGKNNDGDNDSKTSNDKLIQTGMYLNINLIIISLLSIIVIRRTSRV